MGLVGPGICMHSKEVLRDIKGSSKISYMHLWDWLEEGHQGKSSEVLHMYDRTRG